MRSAQLDHEGGALQHATPHVTKDVPHASCRGWTEALDEPDMAVKMACRIVDPEEDVRHELRGLPAAAKQNLACCLLDATIPS